MKDRQELKEDFYAGMAVVFVLLVFLIVVAIIIHGMTLP